MSPVVGVGVGAEMKGSEAVSQSKTRPLDGQTSKVLHPHHATKRKHRSELSKRTITPNYVRLSNYARQQ
jgi:hypothetical protein